MGCTVVGQRADRVSGQSAPGSRQATLTALIIAMMFSTSLFLAGPATADGDIVETTPGTSQPVDADTDMDPAPAEPETAEPELVVPPLENLQPPVKEPVTPAQPPAIKLPPTRPDPAPVEVPANPVQAPTADPAPVEVPVEVPAEEVVGTPADTDTAPPSPAAPATTAPATTVPATTVPSTTAPSTPGNLDPENASLETSNRATPVWLQLGVVALLLAVGVAYTRFMRRGSRPLNAATGPKESK